MKRLQAVATGETEAGREAHGEATERNERRPGKDLEGASPTWVFWILLPSYSGTLSPLWVQVLHQQNKEIKIRYLSKLPLVSLFLGYTFQGLLLGPHFYKPEHSSAGLSRRDGCHAEERDRGEKKYMQECDSPSQKRLVPQCYSSLVIGLIFYLEPFLRQVQKHQHSHLQVKPGPRVLLNPSSFQLY